MGWRLFTMHNASVAEEGKAGWVLDMSERAPVERGGPQKYATYNTTQPITA